MNARELLVGLAWRLEGQADTLAKTIRVVSECAGADNLDAMTAAEEKLRAEVRALRALLGEPAADVGLALLDLYLAVPFRESPEPALDQAMTKANALLARTLGPERIAKLQERVGSEVGA